MKRFLPEIGDKIRGGGGCCKDDMSYFFFKRVDSPRSQYSPPLCHNPTRGRESPTPEPIPAKAKQTFYSCRFYCVEGCWDRTQKCRSASTDCQGSYFIQKSSVADPGCLSRIPDPTFFHLGSRIRIKEFKYPLSSSHKATDPGSGSATL